MKKILAILGLAMLAHVAQAAVWIEENQWSPEWEQKYHEWLKVNAKANMFSAEKKADGQPNPYYGIRVDCADTVYSLRILFSFENKLPFGIVNPVAPNGALITNAITRFDSAQDGVPRLRKFLTWIYDLVSTNGVARDTYSIAFKDVSPGAIILTTHKNHHSWTITDISKTGNPTLIFNSTNMRLAGFNVQVRQSWPNPFWVFEPEVDKNDETKTIPVYHAGSYAGLRYWRPLNLLKASEAEIPGHSDEQFEVGIGKWKRMAQTSIASIVENVDQAVKRLLNDACADLTQRVDAVKEAEAYKAAMAEDFAAGKTEEQSAYVKDYMSDPERPSDKRCLVYKAFDQLSTPSRDKRFVDSLVLARSYFKYGMKKFGEKAFSAENLALYKAMFPLSSLPASQEARKDDGKSLSNFCSFDLPDVGSLSLVTYKRRVFLNRFTSNPNDSYTGRFGSGKTAKDLGSVCPVYDLEKQIYDLNTIEKDMDAEVSSSSVAL
jgi:hypothetical protein